MSKDPIVEEVRNLGLIIDAECDHDIHKFGQMLKEGTEQLRKEG